MKTKALYIIGLVLKVSLSLGAGNSGSRPILEIHFAGKFEDDTVGLIFNNNLIIGNRIFNSDQSDFGDNVVYINATDKKYVILYEGDTSAAKLKNEKSLTLNFQMNNTHDNVFKDNVFIVDPAKGKYITITKKDQLHLAIKQTATAPK